MLLTSPCPVAYLLKIGIGVYHFLQASCFPLLSFFFPFSFGCLKSNTTCHPGAGSRQNQLQEERKGHRVPQS